MYKGLMRKFKERKIFKNIFLSAFSISTLFIVIACLIAFSWFQSAAERWVVQNEQKALSNYKTVVDNYILSAKKSLETLYKDVYVQRIIVSNQTDWNDNMSVVARSILNMISVNPRFHSIYIFGTEGLLLKSSNYPYPTTTIIDSQIQQVFTNSFMKPLNLWSYTDVYGKENQILNVSMGETSNTSNLYNCGVTLNLDIGRITEELFPKTTEKESYLILDSNGVVLGANSEKYSFKQSIAKEAAIAGIFQSKDSLRTFSIRDEGIKYSVSSVYSKESGYYIVHILPYSSFLDLITKMRIIVILFGILFIFTSLCISVVVALKVYNPINEVVDNVMLPESLDTKKVSNKKQKANELSMIPEMIISMAHQINHYTQEKESEYMIHYLSSRHQNPSLPEYFMKYLKQSEKSTGYAVAVLRICNIEDFINDNAEETILFQLQSISGIAKTRYQSIADVYTYIIENEYIAVIMIPKENSLTVQTIEHVSKEIIQLVPELVHLNINIGIVQLNAEPEKLRHVYKAAKAATRYRFIFGKNTVITEEMIQNCAASVYDEEFDLKQLISSVKSSDKSLFISYFEKMIDYIKLHPLEKGYDLLIKLAYEMYRYQNEINHYTSDSSFLSHEKVKEEILSFQYVEEVSPWFITLFEKIHESVNQVQNTGTAEIVASIVKYVNNNYSDPDMNAQFLAEKFSITPSYFSRIFNEVMKCAFPDYLSNIRLEQAKRMLTEAPVKNIQVICEEVGYNNASYFTSLFKKKYGISPSKYRLNNNIKS